MDGGHGQKQRPFQRSWAKSQNLGLGKSGDACSRNGVSRDTNLRELDIQTRWHVLGTLSMAFSPFPLARLFFVFFQSSVYFSLRGRGRGSPLVRTDQISVMPLGNSIIKSHDAKPGVNASTPRRLPLSQAQGEGRPRSTVRAFMPYQALRTGHAEHRCERQHHEFVISSGGSMPRPQGVRRPSHLVTARFKVLLFPRGFQTAWQDSEAEACAVSALLNAVPSFIRRFN
ncbi:hypothetical protein V8C42DRAFT_40152 [Trichoderma barbatum]